MEWMILPLKRYAEFSGRSRRKEYWMFFLLNMIVLMVIMGLRMGTGGAAAIAAGAQSGNPLSVYGAMFGGVGMLMALWWLATLIPNIAVNVRRLHDRDMSGWWYLGFIIVSLIPLIGALCGLGYLVLMAMEGTPRSNRFGPDPKSGGSIDVFS